MALQADGGSSLTVKSDRQREHKNVVPNNRASLLMKVVERLHSTFGTRICSRLTGLNSEGKGESSMTHIQLCDVKNAKNALSEVGRAWVSAGKPRKGVIRDELVRADGRFRVAFCEYYNRRPRYELDSMGNVVILGHGPIYIDRGKITYGGRRAATATVVR